MAAPKVRNVLSLLALRSPKYVSIDTFILELWRDNPPRSAVTTTQTYIYQIRRILAKANEGDAEQLVKTRTPGYLLDLEPNQTDVHRFRALCAYGREQLALGRFEEAATSIRKSLELWRGQPLANVSLGPVLEIDVAGLAEERFEALKMRIETDLRLGRYDELIPELRSLISVYPLNEWLHGKLIVSLSVTGRRADALEAYRRMRAVLREELGLEPSRELQELHESLLRGSVLGEDERYAATY
ncbi:AfsR/SARP family transcriptional regulator [Sciscionella marina]|uniref:AfsR/SARP family transcriptional regulator n=1 Tax=Sciscionella marina TaxID=508770 RepID=UPI00146B9DAC|nr:AfsR/SARP family transcriptional regulator [Sciscionella marina]